MHVHSHMPPLQPDVAPRAMKREPPSEEAYEIRRVFEQAGQRQNKSGHQARPGDPNPADAFEEASPHDASSAGAQDSPDPNQLWTLLGSVTSGPARREPEAAAELSLDALFAQIVKPA